MKIGLLGLGKMGSAIMNGILTSKIKDENEIYAYAHGNKDFDVFYKESELALYEEVDVFIFCIKPQCFKEVLDKLKQANKKPSIIVSIAAGIKIDYLQEELGIHKVVRLMPNTACAFKKGVITMASSLSIEKKDKDFITSIFEEIGKVYPVLEEEINLLLPLNGSFPAYLYYFYRSFERAAVLAGVDSNLAKKVMLETSLGSIDLALKDDRALDSLISDVCSKGGTTIAGVNALDMNNFDKIIQECFSACYNRAKELENK